MTSTARADANRRNAQRSTGPKSPEGKARASMNALKHGLTAESAVLPDEDPEQYDALVRHWSEFYATDDPAEMAMVERAVSSKWKLDRCTRAETARVTERVKKARGTYDFECQATAIRLGKHLTLNALACPSDEEPAAILARMENSAQGVAWLMRSWRGLGATLEAEGSWDELDAGVGVRMLGLRIEHATIDPFLAGVVRAWAATRPGSAASDTERVAAGAYLRGLAEGELSRLGAQRDRLAPLDAESRENAARGAMFDDRQEAVLLRRYETACERELHQAVRDLRALRKDLIQARLEAEKAAESEAERNEAIAEVQGNQEVKKTDPPAPPAPPRVNGPSVPRSDARPVGTAVVGSKMPLVNAV